MSKFWDLEKAINKSSFTRWRLKFHEVIFETDTPAGKTFDILLIIIILLSVIVVMFDSVKAINKSFGNLLYVMEWIFTILFTVEYLFRLACIGRTMMYASSFFGIIDLVAIIPTYISLIFPGTQYFLVIRLLRILRVFRVLKLVQYLGETKLMIQALKASRRKITVFLFVVLTVTIVLGSLMYLIEGEENGFTSIPRSIYWSIVTLTTVGYGDISPKTAPGQVLAALLMILGYGIIAVPTGIVSVELSKVKDEEISTQVCPDCGAEGHDSDAAFCKYCGEKI